MEKLFLLDAYALIYRAYYAFIKNPRINSKGLNTSAILGFCNTLHEVIEKEKPTYLKKGLLESEDISTWRPNQLPDTILYLAGNIKKIAQLGRTRMHSFVL